MTFYSNMFSSTTTSIGDGSRDVYEFETSDFVSGVFTVLATTHAKGTTPEYNVYKSVVDGDTTIYTESDFGVDITHNQNGDVSVIVEPGFEFKGYLSIK